MATQITGKPLFKSEELSRELDQVDTDVVHFHNISLVGGPAVLKMGRDAVRIMTAHEHWLICPMHLLWKYDSKACDQAECLRCVVRGKRPPQKVIDLAREKGIPVLATSLGMFESCGILYTAGLEGVM